MQFVEQLHLTWNTNPELDKILNKYEGDSKREIGEAMRKHGVDDHVYHSGMIVGNHRLTFGEKGADIMMDLKAATKTKIKDLDNRNYLSDTCTKSTNIIPLWYKLMVVMKSKRAQTDETINKFEENTIALNKAIHALIGNPPVPGYSLKYSK